MNYREQEDGRGYATIGRAAWPVDQCTKVEMLQEGSISGMVFQRGDVVWIPTDSLLLYPHRVVRDEIQVEADASATPPTVIVLALPDQAAELPSSDALTAPLLSAEAPTPPPPTKTKRSLFGGNKKKEPSR